MSSDEPEIVAEGPAIDSDVLLDDQADLAEDFVNGLLDILEMDGDAEAEIEDDTVYLDLKGPDMGLLIGRHGATLEAIQELVRAAVQHQTSARVRLILDIDGYRDRQRALLERKAKAVAVQVKRERAAMSMEPMTSYERKIVHDCLADFDGVSTASEGLDPERYVVVLPA